MSSVVVTSTTRWAPADRPATTETDSPSRHNAPARVNLRPYGWSPLRTDGMVRAGLHRWRRTESPLRSRLAELARDPGGRCLRIWRPARHWVRGGQTPSWMMGAGLCRYPSRRHRCRFPQLCSRLGPRRRRPESPPDRARPTARRRGWSLHRGRLWKHVIGGGRENASQHGSCILGCRTAPGSCGARCNATQLVDASP